MSWVFMGRIVAEGAGRFLSTLGLVVRLGLDLNAFDNATEA